MARKKVEETVEAEVVSVVDEPEQQPQAFSRIFPTEIRYESSTGQIESVWVKHGEIKFSYEVDEETGQPADNKMVIQLFIEDSAKDLVVQRFAPFAP